MCGGRVGKIIYSVISLDEDIIDIEGMAGASFAVWFRNRVFTAAEDNDGEGAETSIVDCKDMLLVKLRSTSSDKWFLGYHPRNTDDMIIL